MPPKNIDTRKKKKQDAIIGAIFHAVLTGAGGVFFLWFGMKLRGMLGALMLVCAVLDLGMIIPIWIILKERIKEIEGGEEDAAAQY